MVHVLLQISWLAGALRVIIAALATSRASTQTTFVDVKFVAAICSLLLVRFAGDVKSERPSKDDKQHCCCAVWEGKTVLHSRRCFLRTTSEKLFPSPHSFLRKRTSTCFASSRRFSRWSDNQEDSRLGRVRIIISHRTCALLNAQQKKMVSREACVCAMCLRTAKDCMCACVRTFVIQCWEGLGAVDQTTAVALHCSICFGRCL